MNTNSRLIIALLGFVALGCAFLAYWQHSRLVASEGLVDSLRKDLAALRQQPVPKLQSVSLAISPGPMPEAIQPGKPSAASSRPMPESRGDAGFGGGPFGNLMNNPDVQKLMSIQQRAALDSRYATLFRQLHLSPENLEKFKNLLVEKQTAVVDAMTVARQQGLSGPDNREALKQVIANAQAEVDNNIRSSLGDSAYTQYQSYEQTAPERNLVTQLQQRLSYSSDPLSDDQANRVTTLLAASAAQSSQASGSSNGANRTTGAFGFGPGPFGISSVPITDTVIAGSKGILTSAQVAALVQLQQEQQAQAQLTAQMRANRQMPTPTGGGGPGPVPVPSRP